MLGAPRAGSIRHVLSGRAVRRTFALVLAGRLAYGLLPLPLLFTVRDASGSFPTAATAAAAFGLATFAMPVQTRFVDRWGQRRVVPWYAAGTVTVLLVTAGLSTGRPPSVLWVALAALLGLTAPALGPAMRAQWREIAPDGPAKRAAYSLDAIAEESLYLLGPLLASVVIATGPARTGLVVAAALIAVGTTGLVLSPHVPARSGRRERSTGRGRLVGPGFGRLLLTMLLVGAGGACGFVGLAALADRAGRASLVGLVEAAMALGAVAASLAWSRLRSEPSWAHALLGLVAVTAVAQAVAGAAAPALLVVGGALVVCGAAAAPVFVVAFTTADALVDADRRTEASTWVGTASNGGSATGTALAGLLVTLGASAPFLAAAGLSAVALVVVLSGRQSR